MHWTEPYLMRACPDEWDCADFVRHVSAERFGLDVPLPAVRLPGRREDHGLRARDAQVLAGAERLADPVDAPRDGDVVLMRALGRRRSLGHHVGVWCGLETPHALHLMAGCAHPVLTPIERLPRIGLETVGVYRWRR